MITFEARSNHHRLRINESTADRRECDVSLASNKSFGSPVTFMNAERRVMSVFVIHVPRQNSIISCERLILPIRDRGLSWSQPSSPFRNHSIRLRRWQREYHPYVNLADYRPNVYCLISGDDQPPPKPLPSVNRTASFGTLKLRSIVSGDYRQAAIFA